MKPLVTYRTECDEIMLGIVSQVAPWLKVVHLEIGEAPAELAPPPIPLEHLVAQSFVRLWVKP